MTMSNNNMISAKVVRSVMSDYTKRINKVKKTCYAVYIIHVNQCLTVGNIPTY